MLALIGCGLEKWDISKKALSFLEKADKIYAETYTCPVAEDFFDLGFPFEKLERKDTEEGAGKLVGEAEGKTVVVLIAGDPLSATTHLQLIQLSEEKGVETRVFHAPSVFTAVSETGLQLYKFGRVISLPWHSSPSVYSKILENKKLGLHTLILLDTEPPMGVKDAAKILLDLEKKEGKGLFGENTLLIACSKLGTEEKKIVYRPLSEIPELPAPICLVLPGKMHFTEEEFLEKWKS